MRTNRRNHRPEPFEADDSVAEYRKMTGCVGFTSPTMSCDLEPPHLLRDDVRIFMEAKPGADTK